MSFARELNRKFINYVFRKRLGRKRWSARLIFFIISILSRFEIYSNTEEVDKFDHYVPQLLLNRWRISETGTDKGQLFRWKHSTAKIKKEPISQVAGATDWDITKSKGKLSDYVRNKLYSELLETKGSLVIKIINTSESLDLTYPEESTLAVFIAHQITRVPSFRKSLSRFFSLGISKNLIDQNDFGNKDILTAKVVKNNIALTYDQFLNDPTPIKIEGVDSQIKFISLLIANNIAKNIYRGNLHILKISDKIDDEFVISDNPIIFLDFERLKILQFVPWWEIGKRDFLIFMPISPKKGVFYCNRKRKDGPIEDNNKDLVQLFNFGQYLCCLDEVYGKSREILERHTSLFVNELKKYRLS